MSLRLTVFTQRVLFLFASVVAIFNANSSGAGYDVAGEPGRRYQHGVAQRRCAIRWSGVQPDYFFENKQSFDKFTSGNFEFGANASAVAITAGANAQVSTTGLGAGALGTSDDAGAQAARYNNGVAVFTYAKGGLMYEASLAGQKFTYKPL